MNEKLKYILTYVGGVLTGVVLVFGLLLALGMSQQGQAIVNDKNLVLYETPQGIVDGQYFRVIQVLPNGNALALTNGYGATVLLLCDESTSYYDDEKVRVPMGMQAVQIGTYRYTNRENFVKTVPVIGMQVCDDEMDSLE